MVDLFHLVDFSTDLSDVGERLEEDSLGSILYCCLCTRRMDSIYVNGIHPARDAERIIGAPTKRSSSTSCPRRALGGTRRPLAETKQ